MAKSPALLVPNNKINIISNGNVNIPEWVAISSHLEIQRCDNRIITKLHTIKSWQCDAYPHGPANEYTRLCHSGKYSSISTSYAVGTHRYCYIAT